MLSGVSTNCYRRALYSVAIALADWATLHNRGHHVHTLRTADVPCCDLRQLSMVPSGTGVARDRASFIETTGSGDDPASRIFDSSALLLSPWSHLGIAGRPGRRSRRVRLLHRRTARDNRTD